MQAQGAQLMSNGCISIYDMNLQNNEFTNVIGYKMSGKASMDIDFDHEFTAKMAFPVLADDIDFINNSIIIFLKMF